MNIGISTVYDADNFGAFMQAYALKTVLEKQGHKVFHIKNIKYIKKQLKFSVR